MISLLDKKKKKLHFPENLSSVIWHFLGCFGTFWVIGRIWCVVLWPYSPLDSTKV